VDTEIRFSNAIGGFHAARVFSPEFKLEVVKLVTERGVAVLQAARDLNVAESVLRRWMRELSADTRHPFAGHGQARPEQQEIDRLRREVAKLRAERDILEKAAAYFARGSDANAIGSSECPNRWSSPLSWGIF